MKKLIIWIINIAAAALIYAQESSDLKLMRQNVFVSGQDGYHTYRIPAIIVTPKGHLLAFCEGRKRSGTDHGDIDLLAKISTDMGKSWSEQQIVYEEGGSMEITIGNPCPVLDKNTGTIWLPFCKNNTDVFLTKSTDDGMSWSDPVDITDQVKKSDWGWYATGPGIGIQLMHGPNKDRLIIPCDHREKIGEDWVKLSHVFYSDDAGKNWSLGASVAKHTDECQVVELPDSKIMINMRNYWGREGSQPEKGSKRAVAYSEDGGESWSDLLFDDTLIEPVCQASIIRYSWTQDGKSRILFSNPASADKRINLTVRLSYDDGKTWPVQRLIQEGPSAYSCLVVLPNGNIGCLYETGDQNPYEKIVFARLSLNWLTGN